VVKKMKTEEETVHEPGQRDQIVKELVDTAHEEAEIEPGARVTTVDDDVTVTAKRPIYKRPGFLIIALLIISLATIFGIRYYRYASTHEDTDDAFIEGHVIQVSPQVSGHVSAVHVTDNQEVKEGDLLVEIDPRDYEAQVAQAEAALNAAMTRQRAAEINVGLTSTTSQAQVQQASSGVQLARQSVQTSKATVGSSAGKAAEAHAGVATATANAQQAAAQVTAAEAEAARTNADVARYEQLYSRDEVSRQQLDVARAAAQSANANLEAARRRVAASQAQVAQAEANAASADHDVLVAQSQVGEANAKVGTAQGQLSAANAAPQQVESSKAESKTASAEVQRAQATLDQAKLQLSYTKIYAPQSGRVGRKNVEIGNFIQPGQALMAVVPDQVWVTANFKETQLTNMRPGQPADVRVDAYPGKVFHGHVDSIQPGTGSRFSLLPAENASGNYVKVVQRVPVKIVIDQTAEATQLLVPGMSVLPEVKVK
jgi:membrane fusion protein (multidrug efflux system)